VSQSTSHVKLRDLNYLTTETLPLVPSRMSSRSTRSGPRRTADSPATGSRDLSVTAPAGFGSRGLSATAPKSLARSGSRGLSATAPGPSGSRGPSATTLESLRAHASGALAVNTPKSGLVSVSSSCSDLSSSTLSSTTSSRQSSWSLIPSPFSPPDTASTMTADEQDLAGNVSPLALAPDSPVITHSSAEVAIRKVDEILLKFGLESRKVSLLELLETSSWVLREGGNFLTYKESGNQQYRFVRPSYQDIYQIVQEKSKGKKPHSLGRQNCILISGTPGIGKSVFGEVLCAVVSQQEKRTLLFFEDQVETGRIVVWKKKAYKVADNLQAVDLVNQIISTGVFSTKSHDDDLIDIWSIGDTSIPVTHRSIKSICISSPGQTRIGEFARSLKGWVKHKKALTLVLPPCSWQEINFIRLAHDPDMTCSTDKLRARFELWGGVPRSIILEDMDLTSEQADEEFQNLSIKDVMRYLGTYNLDHREQSGKLFHLLPCFESMTPDESKALPLLQRYNAKNARYYWASEAIERKAWEKFRHEKEADVLDYVLTLNNDPTARGKVLEEQIHKLIQTCGIQGTLREILTDKVVEPFLLRSSNTRFFQDFNEIDDSAQYWRPTSKRHPTCDAYFPESGVMLQMTIGQKHTVNRDGLEKILNSGIFTKWENDHPEELIKLIFVVDLSADTQLLKEQAYRYI
jgi:hypothetical protein